MPNKPFNPDHREGHQGDHAHGTPGDPDSGFFVFVEHRVVVDGGNAL